MSGVSIVVFWEFKLLPQVNLQFPVLCCCEWLCRSVSAGSSVESDDSWAELLTVADPIHPQQYITTFSELLWTCTQEILPSLKVGGI